jgi:DNA-3-methyladenine glycosylase II
MRKLPPVAKAKSRLSPPRLIEADSDLHEGLLALRRKCAVMRRVHDAAGHPPLRRRPGGFEGLARIVVGQQVSVASAEAIWARTVLAVQPFEPHVLLALDDRQLAAPGLSRPKIRTLQAIATAAVAPGGLDLASLDRLPDEDVHAALTAVSGIGPWTADVYLLFCLGRADAWAAGDLALQLAAQQAFGLAERPDRHVMTELAERWRPWRGVAARLLWSYYALMKARTKAEPV